MKLQTIAGEALHVTIEGDTVTIYDTARNTALDTVTQEELDWILEAGYYKQGSNELTINW